ncbi:putative F-box protein At1g32420 [Lycium ferocissimum]|uniref:putative F-box protein At1g32420 n=1 Tax=Lycium ferocissimum TaxID=112874 RepID=UPI0028165410|nr:putative F-box protein At1g32420 [Lycium ferocissimum]
MEFYLSVLFILATAEKMKPTPNLSSSEEEKEETGAELQPCKGVHVNTLRRKITQRYIGQILLNIESDFVHLHQSRSKARKFFLVPKTKGSYIIEQKEDGKASIWNFDFLYDHLMCANGLFSLWTEYTQPVAICNPSTREVIPLPRLKEPFPSKCPSLFYALGYEPEENKYKVLMTVKNTTRSTRSWVFTLGINESWREIKSITDDFRSYREGICISGVIYMVDLYGNFIVAFDAKTENFRSIGWPNALNNGLMYFYPLLEVKGNLAVLKYMNGVDLWILENTGKEEWKSHIICFPSQWKDLGLFNSRTRICGSCDGEIIFVVIKSDMFACYWFDFRKTSWRYLETKGLPDEDWIDFKKNNFRNILKPLYSYVETLFSLKNIPHQD